MTSLLKRSVSDVVNVLVVKGKTIVENVHLVVTIKVIRFASCADVKNSPRKSPENQM